jgi:hypothetical protein
MLCGNVNVIYWQIDIKKIRDDSQESESRHLRALISRLLATLKLEHDAASGHNAHTTLLKDLTFSIASKGIYFIG